MIEERKTVNADDQPRRDWTRQAGEWIRYNPLRPRVRNEWKNLKKDRRRSFTNDSNRAHLFLRERAALPSHTAAADLLKKTHILFGRDEPRLPHLLAVSTSLERCVSWCGMSWVPNARSPFSKPKNKCQVSIVCYVVSWMWWKLKEKKKALERQSTSSSTCELD